MSEVTIKGWVAQEKNAFHNFNRQLAARFEEGIFRSITKVLKEYLKKSGKGRIAMPWGTYTAELVTKGESGNINVGWEPSKQFLTLLNGDEKANASLTQQDEFDPEYVRLVKEFIAYGFFDPDSPEHKEHAAKNKGVRLGDEEVNYFLNGYANVMATIAKDKQRDGKLLRLEINNGFPHGVFVFDYDEDEIKVSFVADKVFKQILKDDTAADAAAENDFTPITEGTRIETTNIESTDIEDDE